MKTPFKELYNKLISSDKIRFLFIGTTGFLVNYIGLFIFYSNLKLSIIIAQIISVEMAIVATFIGNNLWTFVDQKKSRLSTKLISYHIASLMGVLINSLTVIILVKFLGLYFGLALICGSLAGLVWNYNLYRRIIFRKQKTSF